MKYLFFDLKLIYNIDESYVNQMLLMQILTVLLSFLFIYTSGDLAWLFMTVLPIIAFIIAYLTYYKPMIEESYHELYLKRKYDTLLSKFNNTN